MNKTLVFTAGAGRAFWKLPTEVQEALNQKLFLYGLTGEGDVKRMVGVEAWRLRDGDYRVVFEETATALTIIAVGIGARSIVEGRRTVKPQILTTAGGEELVVLARRDYDVLLARLGDEEAEDRLLAEMALRAKQSIADGSENLLPSWLTDRITSDGNPVRIVREHFNCTPSRMAAEAAITTEHLADIESGGRPPSPAVLDAISLAVGLDPRVLRGLYDVT